ncbi:MAG TPA: hypothetical protein VMF07_16065 [Solirubrobacteraceae bacterium]|nr:hypothetical protein [Solirubrobacteraceae bacterium]
MAIRRAAWLSITPEPERELPRAVAVLTAGHQVGDDAVRAERVRLQAIVLRHGLRRWLGYLREVLELIERRTGDDDPDVTHARARARTVLINHHNLLLGLPGPGATLTRNDRARLAELDDPEERQP